MTTEKVGGWGGRGGERLERGRGEVGEIGEGGGESGERGGREERAGESGFFSLALCRKKKGWKDGAASGYRQDLHDGTPSFE